MTPNQLKKRQMLVKASPVKTISSIKNFSRRGLNNIVEQKDLHPNDAFDSFFDYEEEISSLKPSSEQFNFEANRDEEILSEENNYSNKEYTIMESIDSDSAIIMKKNNLTQK